MPFTTKDPHHISQMLYILWRQQLLTVVSDHLSQRTMDNEKYSKVWQATLCVRRYHCLEYRNHLPEHICHQSTPASCNL